MSNAHLDLLKEARASLAKGWTQRAFARDRHGFALQAIWSQGEWWSISGSQRDAVCFCVEGAVTDASMRTLPTLEVIATVRHFLQKHTGMSIWDWNDMPGRTQEEALKLMDEVIERFEKR